MYYSKVITKDELALLNLLLLIVETYMAKKVNIKNVLTKSKCKVNVKTLYS